MSLWVVGFIFFLQEKKLGLAEVKLIMDAKWRWGYCYMMLERFFSIECAVMKLDYQFNLTPEELATLKATRDALKDIVTNLFLLESEKTPTIRGMVLNCGPLNHMSMGGAISSSLLHSISFWVTMDNLTPPLKIA